MRSAVKSLVELLPRWNREGLRKLVGAEVRSPVRFSQPALLARGYNSDRRWLYGTVPRTEDGYVSDLAYSSAVARIDTPRTNRAFVDKLGVARTLEAAGFGDRLPRLLAVVRDGDLTEEQHDRGRPVVLKPLDGRAGHGVSLHPGLQDAVRACPTRGAFLVQERVRAHAYGVDLFPGALNTLRVQTYRPAPGAEARVAVVVQRIGREATAPVDTFGAGGIVARVRSDGTLSTGVGLVTRRHRDEHDAHPETGGRITGRPVPFYEDAVETVLAAMRLWPDARWIGWDVAISEDGPLVVEGNGSWPNLAMLQAHAPLAVDPDLRRFLEDAQVLPPRRARVLVPPGPVQ